jgi:AsmA protein
VSVLRKLLIVLSIFLSLFFLLGFILPRVIELDKYKPALIARGEERINGRVNLKHIELTILNGLGAIFQDIEVLNSDRFGGSPFMRVKQLEVKVRLLPLLAGRISTELIFEAPQILLEKDKEGIFSLRELIRKPSSEAEPKSANKAASWIDRFSISSLRIEEGKVTYINHSIRTPEAKVLTLEDLELKVEELALNTPIPFELAFREGTSTSDRIEFAGKVKVDPDYSRIDFLPTQLTTGDLILEIAGEINDFRSNLNLELSISSNRFNPDRLLSLYSPIARKIPPKLSLSGLSSLKGTVTGGIDDLLIKSNIDCSENTINYGDIFRKSEGVPADLALSLLIQKGLLGINELRLKLNGLKLRGSGSVDNLPDPKIELKVATEQVELKGWEEVFPSLGLSQLSGRLRLEGVAEGKLKERKGLSFKGGLFLNEVGASVPWLAQEVESLNGKLNFSPDSVTAKNMSLKLGNSDITLDFELSNFDNPKVSFDLSSNQLDFDKLIESSEKEEKVKEGGGPEAKQGEDLLDRFTVQGKIRVARGKVKELNFENLFLSLSLKKKLLDLSDLIFDLYGGSYRGVGKLDMGAEETTYIFQSQLKEVKINELLSQLTSLENLFNGSLSAELSLSGKGITYGSLGNSLSGGGKVSLSKGRISSLSLEKSLSDLSKLEGWEGSSNGTDFQALEGQISIGEGKVNTSELRLSTAELTVTARGYFDRKRQVNFQAQAVLSRKLSQSLEMSSGGNFFKDEGERIVIPFHLKGTIDSPKFNLDQEMLEKGQKEWALRKTEAELNKAINIDLNR